MAMYTSEGTKICETTGGDIVLPDKKEIEHLKRIADSLEEEVRLAKEQAEEAKKKARCANIKSWISIGIAAVASAVALLDYLGKI